MSFAEKQQEVTPEFSYHLLRIALERFNKNLSQLNPDEYRQVYRRASKSFEIESIVLASAEAERLMLSEQQLDRMLDQIISRYDSTEEFTQDMQANGLDRDGLRHALYRELLFNEVMEMVAANSVDVSDLDVRLFFELQHERFESPEQRTASHILITVNPDYPENTLAAARAKMEQVVEKLDGRANRFQEFAKRYSECPTAMQGGKLGDVTRGQLYAELDSVLFTMEENRISPIIQSELGFHLLLCEKIKPAKREPFSKVEPRIRAFLQERQRRNCQKAWLTSLQNACRA